MYKVFAVDDEPLVLEGLEYTINWTSIGYIFVGKALSGEEALEKIRRDPPDVLLTDMRMSGMDGPELIAAVKKDYPSIQIVIMTAFNEFAYAKSGLDNGVFAFLTKPALNDEIVSTFIRLREHMDNNRQIRERMELLEGYQADILLKELLQNSEARQDIIDLFRSAAGAAADGDFFAAVLLPDPLKTYTVQEELDAVSSLNELLEYEIVLSGFCIYKATLSRKEIALLVFTETHDYEKQTAFLKEISLRYRDQGYSVSIGISATFRHLITVHRAYLEALQAAEYRTHIGYGRITDYMEISRRETDTANITDEEIHSLIRSASAAPSEQQTAAVFREFIDSRILYRDLLSAKQTAVRFVTEILKTVYPVSKILRLVYNSELRPANDILSLPSVRDIEDYLLPFIEKTSVYLFYMKIFRTYSGSYSPLIRDALNYIQTNFNSDISVTMAADSLHISESHLMHLFKSEVGVTFKDYLTEFRIQFAEVLIHTRRCKLYEIAELVGYNSLLSFRRAFTRYTGQIPSRYDTEDTGNALS